jgi:hypothetical protein
MENRRTRTRVPFHTQVDVQATGMKLRNLETRDLSHKGVFLLGESPLQQGQGCTVSIHLPGDESTAPILHMEGKVARITKEGTAIDFISMDPDTYMHLRNLVLLNAEDPEKAEREFSQPAFEVSGESDSR